MKHLIIGIMLLSSVSLFEQVRSFNPIPKDVLEQLDKMGVDDSLLLNGYESACFNVIFENARKSFDFTAKNVGFMTGSSGEIKSSKGEYFKLEKDRFNCNYSPNGETLYIFDAVQKEESGRYDATIVYWSKILVSAKDIVKRLKGK
jgi:hypothetical protein